MKHEVLGYICSIFIGVVLGLLGGGGSILSIPILVYLFQVDAVSASAYSLFIVGATSCVGAIQKYKENLVNMRAAFAFIIPSVISIFTTRKWIIPSIPDVVWQNSELMLTKRMLLLGLFALLMVLASVPMLRGGLKQIESENHRYRYFLIALEGSLIGCLTGLVGAGGGFLIIPALVLLTGLKFKAAVGTSLFIIAISTLSGFLGDATNYALEWQLLLTITSLAIIGVLIGNKFSKHIPSPALKKIFGWFTLLIGSWILYKEIFLQ